MDWQTAGVAFVTLAGWLIGLLADAGRKRLTTFVLGSEQERALRSAAKAAVRLTVEELPSGDEAQVELVINQVFSEPMLSAPPAKHRIIWTDCTQASPGSWLCSIMPS